jgi:catechol 2,3-dioxygenase-like lactoylglutathione lyase family enzyme
MGVMRLGYVHARVTDLEEAKQHYGTTLGLKPMREEDGRVFFKLTFRTSRSRFGPPLHRGSVEV